MFGQWVLCKYSAETTQVTTSTASLQIQHVHLGLVSCWDNKCAITRSWSLALREVKNLTGLCRLIGKVGGSTTPVAPADVADDLGILHSFNGAVESLDCPILEAIGPGKFVELNEINAEGIYFDLTDLDIRQALSEGPQGFVFHNYTNAELFRILQKPEWLAKTGFYRNSQPTSLAGNLTEGGHSWISAMNTARPRKRSSLHSQSGVAAGPESGSTRPRCRG